MFSWLFEGQILLSNSRFALFHLSPHIETSFSGSVGKQMQLREIFVLNTMYSEELY